MKVCKVLITFFKVVALISEIGWVAQSTHKTRSLQTIFARLAFEGFTIQMEAHVWPRDWSRRRRILVEENRWLAQNRESLTLLLSTQLTSRVSQLCPPDGAGVTSKSGTPEPGKGLP